jgi:hypothetical protein
MEVTRKSSSTYEGDCSDYSMPMRWLPLFTLGCPPPLPFLPPKHPTASHPDLGIHFLFLYFEDFSFLDFSYFSFYFLIKKKLMWQNVFIM